MQNTKNQVSIHEMRTSISKKLMIPVLTVKLFYMGSGRVLEDRDDVFDSVFESDSKDKDEANRNGGKGGASSSRSTSNHERVFSLSPKLEVEPEPEDENSAGHGLMLGNEANPMSPGIGAMVQA